MSARSDFDGFLSDWLDDKAGRGAPDYADEILARTTRTRQRPAWSSLERWLPMQTTLRFAPVPRLAWVLLIVLAVVAAIGIAVLTVGSRQHPVPPPFGPARNGAILYAGTDNDIHALDPVTGANTTLITGATGDHRPLLSPDGTKVLFLRDSTVTDPATLTPEPMIMVANADGSDVRPLTGPLASFEPLNVAWSHDGSKVAVVASEGAGMRATLQVVTVDGSIAPVVIDTQTDAPRYPAFRPGDRQITFRGSNSNGGSFAVVAADGSRYRPILATTDGEGGSLSPDGTKIAYNTWDGTVGTLHVLDVDAGVDSVPNLDPPSSHALIDDVPEWSPDGKLLVFVRFHGSPTNRFAVAPATGGPVVEIGPTAPSTTDGTRAQFSPDGTRVLAYYGNDGSTWILDPTGATPGTQLSSTIADAASWQRTAP